MAKITAQTQALIDAEVRRRIAEIMSAAGVERSRISQEVLYELPGQFVRAYELLYDLATAGADRALRDPAEVGVLDDPDNKGGGSGGRVRDTERTRERYAEVVVRSGGSIRRAVRAGAKGSAAGLRLGEDEALELKTRIDKRLRGIAREIHEVLAPLGLGVDDLTGEIMVRVGRVDRSDRRGAGSVAERLTAIDASSIDIDAT